MHTWTLYCLASNRLDNLLQNLRGFSEFISVLVLQCLYVGSNRETGVRRLKQAKL